MTTSIFISILNMSFAASIVALAVLLIRIPLKKAPKKFSYMLWGVDDIRSGYSLWVSLIAFIAVMLVVAGFSTNQINGGNPVDTLRQITASNTEDPVQRLQQTNSNNDESALFRYADLEKIAATETRYVGDASKVGGIISNLPQPSVYHIQNMFSLQTKNEPCGLTVYYEYSDYGGDAVPFWYSKMENNALILFSYIENVEHITFAYRDSPSNGVLEQAEYVGTYEYSRADFLQRFGDFAILKQNLAAFDTLLLENLKIDPFRIQYDRIGFESTEELVIYRIGEPDEIIQYGDNSSKMVYKNLGETKQFIDNSFTTTIPGDDVTIYLDGNGIQGVYAVSIEGSSEILDGLGIEGDLTYSGITKKLGHPQKAENNNAVISYLIYNSANRYVTFSFDEFGNLIRHGFS